MDFYANPGKQHRITMGGRTFVRHLIQTRFVEPGDDYLALFKQYVSPVYQPGDIVSVSERMIALCQNRVIYRDQIHIGRWAKLLSKFASHPTTGVGVGETIKMQFAIDVAGLPRVIFASVASGVTKLVGKKGVFYEIVGPEVAGLDGFYDHVWSQNRDMGIRLPDNPNGVCNEIHDKLGISLIIVDANDLGQELLGSSDDLAPVKASVIQLVADNPTGQGRQLTPLVLCRPEENFNEATDHLLTYEDRSASHD